MLLTRSLLIFLTTLISINSLAEDSVFLNKGQAAPYEGFLLDKEKVLDYRNTTFERDSLKLQNASLNTSLSLQNDIIARKDQQLKLYGDQMDKLATTAYNAENMSSWQKVGYIALGVLITGLAIKGVQALK